MMYVERQRGVCYVFVGIEHILKNEELEEKFNKQVKKKDGCVPRMPPGSPRREQVKRTRSTCEEERSGRLRIAWAGWLTKRKEPFEPFFATREGLLERGYLLEETFGFSLWSLLPYTFFSPSCLPGLSPRQLQHPSLPLFPFSIL